MRVEINEYAKSIQIELRADTVKDAAQLVRIGMNKSKSNKLVYNDTYAGSDGLVMTQLSIVKRRDETAQVRRDK